ncbi:MAG: peroxide stress protein YaaA [Nocardioides sp.]
MLILLPPSEGKAVPRLGKPLELADLSFPVLTRARGLVLDALVDLCSADHDPHLPVQTGVLVDLAARTLGLGATQLDLVHLNGRLRTAPSARADKVYTGVLYDALDATRLSTAAKRRASSRLAITSSLFGLVRPGDRIPAYRLSGDTTLPGLGPVAGVWREHLGDAILQGMGDGLLVDLRSTTYAAFWRPPASSAERVATVRVLHEVDGKRQVVSHFNKATKGRIVRDLLEDGRHPRTPGKLADLLTDLGWKVELGEPGRKGTQLDVVVDDV